MKNDDLAEARRWLLQSKRDLDDARCSADGGRHNLVCFLSQQAAEKSLKAFLYSRGAESVRGHSAAELCTDASDFDADFVDIKREQPPSTSTTSRRVTRMFSQEGFPRTPSRARIPSTR
jgi:HEPN domain-containing protein